jgi:NADH-quinone oxidoreductase subunit M
MTHLVFPWLLIAVLAPLASALWLRFRGHQVPGPQLALCACGVSLVAAGAAWIESIARGGGNFYDPLDPAVWLGRAPLLEIDSLSAPLLPLVSLLYLLTMLATLRTMSSKFSASNILISAALLLATLACKQPWIIALLMAAGTLPPALELWSTGKPLRIFALHMGLFIALLLAGLTLLTFDKDSTLAIVLLMAAVLIRSGIVPMHIWIAELFEHASLTTALLFVTPLVGAYATMRIVLPIAPEWVLRGITILSVLTAIYAAGMALVQVKARRFFSYLFLSHASLVFVGLETATALGLTGALCAWLSISLSMTGFGLTLRSIEARTGPIRLDQYHGLYEHIPRLAALFLVTGLASIGFPGTAGFVGGELLVEGAVQVFPLMGAVVVIVAALNGIAVLAVYFRIFTGIRNPVSIDLGARPLERIAIGVLIALIIGVGLYPQPVVRSRFNAATKLVNQRAAYFHEQPVESDQVVARSRF